MLIREFFRVRSTHFNFDGSFDLLGMPSSDRTAKSLRHSHRFFKPKHIETVVKIKVSGSNSKEYLVSILSLITI